MTEARLWVLGATDPEMAAIEALLRQCGEPVAYALDARSHRILPGKSPAAISIVYATDPGRLSAGYGVSCATIADTLHVYAVECDGLGSLLRPLAERFQTTVINHHAPGDPGFGRLPAEFMAGSSIGQVIAELARLDVLPHWPSYWLRAEYQLERDIGEYTLTRACTPIGGFADVPTWHVEVRASERNARVWAEVPHELVLTAAADHCLGAAYRGECPGVDPDELMRWRANSRAKFQRRSLNELLADIAAAQQELRAAPRISLDPHTDCADMRRETPIRELPEAALRLGMSYVSGPLIGPDGRRKYTCSGSSVAIHAFLHTWAPAQGLTDLYGHRARGFAGGYAEATP